MKSPTQAFTVIELLVVVAIIVILVGFLMPMGSRMLENSRATKCSSNLRQIGVALNSYADDHNQLYPMIYDGTAGEGSTTWMWKLKEYLSMPDNSMGPSPLPRAAGIFVCPSLKPVEARGVSYALNGYMLPSSVAWQRRRLVVPASQTFLVVEIAKNGESYTPTMTGGGELIRRHPKTSANYLFCDSHVENITGVIPSTDPRWYFVLATP